jgi:amino acid permease
MSGMNVKLLLGIVLFVIGLATAVVGIAGVGRNDVDAAPPTVVDNNRSQNLSEAGRMTIPLIAGFSLAIGGLLIGLSVGNWKNPRTNLKHTTR